MSQKVQTEVGVLSWEWPAAKAFSGTIDDPDPDPLLRVCLTNPHLHPNLDEWIFVFALFFMEKLQTSSNPSWREHRRKNIGSIGWEMHFLPISMNYYPKIVLSNIISAWCCSAPTAHLCSHGLWPVLVCRAVLHPLAAAELHMPDARRVPGSALLDVIFNS